MSKNVVEPEDADNMVPARGILDKPMCVEAHTSTPTHTHRCICMPSPTCARAESQKYVILTAFHGNSGFVNAHHCNVTYTASRLKNGDPRDTTSRPIPLTL